MNPQISIIMPVYNASKYLRCSIESVLHQTYSDFELIIINDGSTDSSQSIIDWYAQRDSRIVSLIKKNTGVSDTRNQGLMFAKGKYIAFLDADDFFEKDFLKEMYCKAEHEAADIVVCGYSLMNSRGEIRELNIKYSQVTEKPTRCDEVFDRLLEIGLGIQIWNKLFSRKIIIKDNLLFDTGVTFDEDMFFNWKMTISSKKTAICPLSLYRYRLTDSSSIMNYHQNLLNSYKSQFEVLREYASAKGVYSEPLENQIRIQFSKKIPILLSMELRSNKSPLQIIRQVKLILEDEDIQKGINIRIHNGEKKLVVYHRKIVSLALLQAYLLEIKTRIARKVR